MTSNHHQMAFDRIRRAQTQKPRLRNERRGHPGIKDGATPWAGRERGGGEARRSLKSQGWRAMKAFLMRPIPPGSTRSVSTGSSTAPYTHRRRSTGWNYGEKRIGLSDDSNDYVTCTHAPVSLYTCYIRNPFAVMSIELNRKYARNVVEWGYREKLRIDLEMNKFACGVRFLRFFKTDAILFYLRSKFHSYPHRSRFE